MKYFLCSLIILVALILPVQSAHAAIPSSSGYGFVGSGGCIYYPDAATACNGLTQIHYSSEYYAVFLGGNRNSCELHSADTSEDFGANYVFSCKLSTPFCPSNSALSGSSCICNSGYKPNGKATACIPTK